jgi:hypothetical protein
MVMPAAMVRSESALREAGQIAPELLGEKHSVSPTMFVTRSAPPGAVPAYAQDPKALSKVRESDRLAGALIDFLHANSDRHDGNVLVDERGRVVLIDHDLTADTGAPSSVFFPGGGLEYSQRQSRLADLPKTAREYVSKIAGMDVDALSESFSLSNDAAATMKKRAQSVVHDGLDAALVKHEAWWQLVAPKASEERMGDVVAR